MAPNPCETTDHQQYIPMQMQMQWIYGSKPLVDTSTCLREPVPVSEVMQLG